MAKKPNYNFEKRKKEQDKKQRQEEKLEEKRRRKQEGALREGDASDAPSPDEALISPPE